LTTSHRNGGYSICCDIIIIITVKTSLFSSFLITENNGWQYEKLCILKLQPFNLPRCLINVKIFIFCSICPIFYIGCYMLPFCLLCVRKATLFCKLWLMCRLVRFCKCVWFLCRQIYSLIFSPPFTTNPSTGAYISLKVGLVIGPV